MSTQEKEEYLVERGWEKDPRANKFDNYGMIWADPRAKASFYTVKDAYSIQQKRENQ